MDSPNLFLSFYYFYEINEDSHMINPFECNHSVALLKFLLLDHSISLLSRWTFRTWRFYLINHMPAQNRKSYCHVLYLTKTRKREPPKLPLFLLIIMIFYTDFINHGS